MATQMPPVAQFTLPQPNQQPQQQNAPTQLLQGTPPVAQFQLPQSAQPQSSQQPQGQIFSTPLTNIASGNAQAGQDTLKGAIKGGLQVARDVSGVDTNPVVKQQLANAPQFAQNVEAEKSAIQPTNLEQQKGAAMSQLGAALIGPGSEAKSAYDAAQVAKVPSIAKEFATPKQTLGIVEKGLMSFGENPQVVRDAKAIEPLVQNKILKLGDSAKVIARNVENLKGEIGRTAEGLISRLENSDIQPILQRSDLEGTFSSAMKQIEENPYLDDSAKSVAQKMFNLFTKQLPKGKDIVAADLLKARKSFDSVIGSMKPGAFDPKTENATSLALRAIRQNVNNLIAEKAPDAGVKESLSHQTSLYNVLENLAKKGAPAIKKAQEVENLPLMQKLMAQHPIATRAVELGAGLTGTGIIGGGIVGHMMNQQR